MFVNISKCTMIGTIFCLFCEWSAENFCEHFQMYQDWNNWKLFSQKNSIFQVIFRFAFPNVLKWEHFKLFTRNKDVFFGEQIEMFLTENNLKNEMFTAIHSQI